MWFTIGHQSLLIFDINAPIIDVKNAKISKIGTKKDFVVQNPHLFMCLDKLVVYS